MFYCALLCVHSSFAIILMEKRELVALFCLSSWCLKIVVWLFLTMPPVCLQFVILVFPDLTHFLSPNMTFLTMWYVRPAQPVHMRSLIRAFANCLKDLQHLEFLSFK